MISFNNITIVIPTYKRYPFLKRLLKFYKSYNIPINILILDSTPSSPSDQELIHLLSNRNILWKKYDSEKDEKKKKDILEKINQTQLYWIK